MVSKLRRIQEGDKDRWENEAGMWGAWFYTCKDREELILETVYR